MCIWDPEQYKMGHFSIRLILPRNTREIRTACKREIFAWYFWITSLAVCKRVTRVSGWRLSSSVPSENFCRSLAQLCCSGWKVRKILFAIILHLPALCWQSYSGQWWGLCSTVGESRSEANHLKEGQFGKKVCWPLFRTTQATTEKERAGTGVGQRGELQ